jgi:hypothetical protein
MRRMILLFFIGAFFVYALAFMAFLVGLLAVALSLAIYASIYAVMHLYAKVAGRVAPKWGWETKIWYPSRDFIQGVAIYAGVGSLAGMVVMLIAYAASDRDWGTAIGVTVAFWVFAGLFGLKEWMEARAAEEVNPPQSSGPTS